MKHLLLSLIFSSALFGVTANKVWRVPSGGTIPSWGPVNLADGTNAITGALPSKSNLPTVGQQVSSDSGSYTTSSGVPQNITNLSVNITTTGRPVMVGIMGSPGTSLGCSMASQVQSTNLQIFRFSGGATAVTSMYLSPSVASYGCNLIAIDVPAAGTYSYFATVTLASAGGGANFFMTGGTLFAYEL